MKTWIPDRHFLPYLTWKEVEALPKDRTLLVLPTAAIEQHGHHLPLATDTLISNLLLGRALEQLPDDFPIYALPPICYGKSNEHIGYPGTLSVSASTMMAVIRDIGASIHAAGFRKLVIFNTHGGNTSLIDIMARDLRAEFGLRVFTLSGGGGIDGLSRQEAKYGFHANEFETAVLLAATPEMVHTDKYTVNYIAQVDQPGYLTPEGGFANFAWLTRDIAPSGVMGDPRPATAENGEKWIAQLAARIATVLQEMAAYRNALDEPHG